MSKDHCFLDKVYFNRSWGFVNTLEDMKEDKTQKNNHIPDMTDMDEIRKAIIANEILNRKY